MDKFAELQINIFQKCKWFFIEGIKARGKDVIIKVLINSLSFLFDLKKLACLLRQYFNKKY